MELHTIRFRFSHFELDSERLELRAAGTLVPLEPKPLRLLLLLLEHRDRWLSKEKAFAALWPHEVVSDASLARAVRDVRRALGDNGAEQRWIRTRRKVGYRFAGSVEVILTGMERSPSGGRRRTRLYGAPRGISTAFVGRTAELAQVEAILASGAHVSVQASIEGLAGVGKTEVALQLVHKLAHDEKFSGGVFWLDAESPDLRAAWGTTIADQLGIPMGPLEERSADLVRRLEAASEPILVVLDNVESWAPRAKPRPLPRGPHVRVLVTTRSRNLGGAQFHHVDLGMLEPPHDTELFVSLAGPDSGLGTEALVRYLGGHTLALELAGAFLATYPTETPRSYLAALRQGSHAVEEEVKDRVLYERTVAEAFRTIWVRLPRTLQDAWRLASCFEPEPATRDLAAAVGLEDRALRSLEALHLIRSAGAGRWIMHRLTRAFGQTAGGVEDTAAARRAFLRGCAARAATIDRASGFSVYLMDCSHIDAALACAPELLDPASELALLLSVGPALTAQRGYGTEEAKRLYQRAIELCEKTDQQEEVLLALEGLWQSAVLQGDYRMSEVMCSRLNELLHRQGMPEYRVVASRARGQQCLLTGRIKEACAEFEEGIQSLRDQKPRRFRTVQDPGVLMLSNAAISECLAGRPDCGLRFSNEALERASRLEEMPTLAAALILRVSLDQLRLEPEEVARHAAMTVEVAAKHGLVLFQALGAVQLCWARIALGHAVSESERRNMDQCLEDVARMKFGFARTFFLVVVADVALRQGDPVRARQAVEDGLQVVEQDGERFMEPELWRIRAAVSENRAERVQNLERARRTAAEQGSRWFSLRVATDWVDAADTDEARARAREGLRTLLSELSEGLELRDFQRARAVLA